MQKDSTAKEIADVKADIKAEIKAIETTLINCIHESVKSKEETKLKKESSVVDPTLM